MRGCQLKTCLGAQNFGKGLLGDTDWKRVLLWGAVDHRGPWGWALGCVGKPRDRVRAMWAYRILRTGGQGAIWAVGCLGKDLDICYRKPRSGGQVSMCVRDYRMLEWETGSPQGGGPELWDSQGWVCRFGRGPQPGSVPCVGLCSSAYLQQ